MKERLRDPRVIDSLIALAMFALAATSTISIGDPVAIDSLYRERDFLAYLLIAGQTIPLVMRRSQPRLMTVLIGLAWGVDRWLEYSPGIAGFTLIIAFHAIGAYMPPKQSARVGWTAAGAVLAWTTVGVFFSDVVPVAAVFSSAVVVVLPLIIGREVYQRRRRVLELEERAEIAEREKKAEALRAVAEERERIARELHDVVAHQMTVMALQAEGARRVSAELDPRVDEALAVISEAGRSALDEMQRMVTLLRSGPAHDALAPQPTLAEIPTLVGQITDAGLPVEIEVVGEAHPLGPGLELTAYRVIQESLTNSLKYAGPGAIATVQMIYEDGYLSITVSDDGRGTAAPSRDTGHGLIGMRERVMIHDGVLTVGPRSGGGYQVSARLPVPA